MLKKIIIRYLLLKIQAKEIGINEKLPSETQLKIKFNCNRHTASSALKELTKKGLLKFKKGVGHFLIKNYKQITDISTYVPYSFFKQKKFILEKIPIRLLAIFDFSSYKPKIVSDFYINNIHNATQYIFINKNVLKKIENNVNYNDFFKFLGYHDITIFDLKKEISFINNEKTNLNIKDDFITVLKIVLNDENNNKIATFYNLFSNRYFMVKKEIISI